MKAVLALIQRNRKLYFKDKGMLFSSLITPAILIVLYATFWPRCIGIPSYRQSQISLQFLIS